jgi:hypothetical protein
MISKMAHCFIPNLAGMEVKVKLDNCRKIAGEEVSVPVHHLSGRTVRHLRERV